MKRIASFSVDHNRLERGMYLSRVDGDVVTYDIRMKKPNGGDYLANAAIHTFEHLFATYVRNSPLSDLIVYIGPMGCRTGFYFLVRDGMSREQALSLMRETLRFIAGFEGEIPGTRPEECGNYREHDLAGAKREAEAMLPVLERWTPAQMEYAAKKAGV